MTTTSSDAAPAPDTGGTPTSEREARKLDRRLQEYCQLPTTDQPEACRLTYEMSQGAYRALGFRSFSTYLRQREIPPSWAYLRKAVHEKLVVELGLPPSAWQGVPLSKLRLALPVLTADNATDLLEAARTLTPAAFRRRVVPGTKPRSRVLTGTYRLFPTQPQQCTRADAYHHLSGTVYAAGDEWFVDFPEDATT